MVEIDIYNKKELRIKINTEGGQTTFETDKIDNYLEAIILQSSERIEIIIESELGYLVFHRREHQGVEYYPVRSIIKGSERKLTHQDQFTKFKLNEKLNIVIIGRKNQEVNLILRFS
ncbi:MAG: hypothetical protein ACTSUC_09845 [Promethearchaeota archaeon]